MKASQTSIVIGAGVLGAALGLCSYTFACARGWAYMTNDPLACANCHTMNEQYDGHCSIGGRSACRMRSHRSTSPELPTRRWVTVIWCCPHEWRLLGPVEGLTGILMCGLSIGFFFAVVSRFLAAKSASEQD
jgi:hypothetical protein